MATIRTSKQAKMQFGILGKRIEQGVARRMRDITLDLMGTLKSGAPEGTPVDTGWAVSNWIPSVKKFRRKPVGSKENRDFAPQNNGLATIVSGFTVEQGPIYIVNNVPYIGFLNSGRYKAADKKPQPEAGWVERAITKAVERNRGRSVIRTTGGAFSK